MQDSDFDELEGEEGAREEWSGQDHVGQRKGEEGDQEEGHIRKEAKKEAGEAKEEDGTAAEDIEEDEEEDDEFYSRVFEPEPATSQGSISRGILRERTRNRRRKKTSRHVTLEANRTDSRRSNSVNIDSGGGGEKNSLLHDKRRQAAAETFEWIAAEAPEGGSGEDSEQVQLLKNMVYKLSLELR